jgi:hypothetical protein
MRSTLFRLLLFAVLLESSAGAGKPWQTRLRTNVAGALQGLAGRIAPRPEAPPPSLEPPKDLARRSGYQRSRKVELSPRGTPGKPDKLNTTITETWSERVVTSSSRVVPGLGMDLGSLGSDKDKAKEGRSGVWKRLTVARGYLDKSTPTLRKDALALIDRIVAEAPGATFDIHDGQPVMNGKELKVYTSRQDRTTVIKISVYEAKGWPPIAEMEFDYQAGTFKLHDSNNHVTITETRTGGDRANVERKTTSSREITNPGRQQRLLDKAFELPPAATP